MLGLFNVKTEISLYANTKCAEVYFHTINNFTIVCTFCDIKNFEFNDFLLHFKNVHLEGIGTTQTPVKNEESLPFRETDEKFACKDSIQNCENTDIDCKKTNIDVELNTDLRNSRESTASCSEVGNSSEDFLPLADSNEESKDVDYVPKVLKRPTEDVVGKYECTECKKSYKLPKSLNYHKIRCHSSNKTLQCSHCHFECNNERLLSRHVRKEHNEFPCDQCDKTYKSQNSLKYHKIRHTGELNFICEIDNCGKAFFHNSRLNAHKNFAHSKERKYVCEICGFGLKSRQALDIHTRSHTGEKPYPCQECGRRFASTSQLAEHKAMHSTERPHICDVCGASFGRPKALYHHKHLHLDKKKFVCKICGKAYAQAAGLCGHMRQHKLEKS